MYRENAENNQIMINPETKQSFEPEYELADDGVSVKVDENFQGVESKTAAQVQDEYATNELLRLNKITAQYAAQRKTQFGQNVEYKNLKYVLETNIENFDKIYDPTKLSTELNIFMSLGAILETILTSFVFPIITKFLKTLSTDKSKASGILFDAINLKYSISEISILAKD